MGMRDQWEADKLVAKGLLANRRSRRKALTLFASLMLGMFALGLWGIDGWLKEHALRFGVYWAACGLLCLFVMMFALFDALAVIKEERER